MGDPEADPGVVFSSNWPPQVSYCAGLLGATADHAELLEGARLEMIERRILRLEMLLRRAGIEPESIPLPR